MIHLDKENLLNKFWHAVVICTFLIIGIIFYAHSIIIPYNRYVYHDINTIPEKEIGLVFGGGMKEIGVQSDMQLARVNAGIDLYKKGKVKKLVMTGDDGAFRINEVDYMRSYAIENGIPINDISVDPHGYRTYESCIRASTIFNLSDVIVISQDFHLPRIIYFCKNFGIETIGFSADYKEVKLSYKIYLREMLARVKGLWQVKISKPEPMVLEASYSLF